MKKIWKILLVILIILFIAIALSPAVAAAVSGWLTTAGFPVLASLVVGLGGLALPWYVAVGAALGLAYLIDPDTTAEIIDDLGEVVTEVGGAVVGAVGSVASTALSSVLPWALGALGLYLAFGGGGGKDKVVIAGAPGEEEDPRKRQQQQDVLPGGYGNAY